MKIAIVHDFLNQYGGAERCVETLHELFPKAPIFTSFYLSGEMPKNFGNMDIRSSFMQRMPFVKRHFKKYLMLYPKAVGSLDVREYDVILSSSSAFAKGIKVPRGAKHICYCYTPMRFVWEYERYIEKERFSSPVKSVISLCNRYLRKWDLKTNDSVNEFISISGYIRDRIRKCYGRESTVIYPPVNTGNFKIARNTGKYFLVVSRLNPYKRVDLVIEAFNALKLPLKVVGEGPARPLLEKMAGPTVEFTGRLSESELVSAYENCRAFIFPGEEDFGIAPVEAQAAGRPVIALGAGGALETIIEGKTGMFFRKSSSESLREAVEGFIRTEGGFDPAEIRKNALRFDKEVFKQNIKDFVEQVCASCSKNLQRQG